MIDKKMRRDLINIKIHENDARIITNCPSYDLLQLLEATDIQCNLLAIVMNNLFLFSQSSEGARDSGWRSPNIASGQNGHALRRALSVKQSRIRDS